MTVNQSPREFAEDTAFPCAGQHPRR